MKIEELAATAMPNSIGQAKLATAGPPRHGRIERDQFRLRP